MSFIFASIFLLFFKSMGLSGLEPPTSRLSGVRSNRLSYKPIRISCAFSILQYFSLFVKTFFKKILTFLYLICIVNK